jgi:integrase
LSEAAVASYRDAVLRECEGLPQARATQIKASANSVLNQVGALCSADALDLFSRSGLLLAGVEAFRKACRLRAFSVPAARKRFAVPGESVVRALFEALPGLAVTAPVQPPEENSTAPEVQRRNFALALGLMLAGGLRKGEVWQARSSWLRGGHGAWRIEAGAAEVKDSLGSLRQRLLPYVWRAVADLWPQVEGDGFALAGTVTERCDHVFRRVAGWMRGLGWTGEKTNHGLRDLAISCVIADSANPYEGQVFARHSSVQVTEAHYGHFAREDWLKRLLAEMKQPDLCGPGW